MANWRPVDVRLWNDRKFLAGGDDARLLWLFLLTCPSLPIPGVVLGGDAARLLWLFLLTCPSLPIPGVVLGGDAALAEMLGWTLERLRERFQELSRNGLRVRRESRIVWLTNALKYQPPANPNMIKCWAGKWDDVPEGTLKGELWEAIRIACKRWSVLFGKLFAKPLPEPFVEPLPEPSPNGSRHEHKHEHKHQHDHDLEEKKLSPAGARAIQPVPDQGPRLLDTLWAEFELERQRVASLLRIELLPLAVHDRGRNDLAHALANARAAGQIDTEEKRVRLAIAVAGAEAEGYQDSQWLTGATFTPDNLRRLSSTTPAKARAAAAEKRAAAQRRATGSQSTLPAPRPDPGPPPVVSTLTPEERSAEWARLHGSKESA